MRTKPELVVDAQAVLGEGPFWEKDDPLLYWIDIAKKTLQIHDPGSGTNRQITVGVFRVRMDVSGAESHRYAR